MQIDLLRSRAEFESLGAEWASLFAGIGGRIEHADATCSFAWARASLDVHHSGAEPLVVRARSRGRTVGLLPVVRGAEPGGRKALEMVMQPYAGRCGFLVDPSTPGVLDAMLGALVAEARDWDILFVAVRDESASSKLLAHALAALRLDAEAVSRIASPYIAVPSAWPALLARLPKKLRWTIRSSDKDLRARGALEYRRCDGPDDVTPLMDAIERIEQASWKEAAGTSITRNRRQLDFYRNFVSQAAAGGVLSGHLLELDGQPIAYILGVIDGPVFCDLKESFDAGFAGCSPGHVLKSYAMPTLIERGVSIYDFMGACESYKMRWTDLTYVNHIYAVYNRNLMGRVHYWKRRLRRLVRRPVAAAVDTA